MLAVTAEQSVVRNAGSRRQLFFVFHTGRYPFLVGAMAVIRYAKPGSKSASAWLLQLLERKPRKVAAVALANKMAWIYLGHGPAW